MTIFQYINQNPKVLLPLNKNEVIKIQKEVENDAFYGAGIRLLGDIIKAKKLNTNPNEVIDKIVIINALNSTNLQTQKSTVKNIANAIKECANFDTLLKNGDKKAVDIIALANKNERINFSFATKYCAYHSYYLYNDDFSIYDNFVSIILPFYAKPLGIEISQTKLKEYKEKCDYESFNNVIKEVLKGYKLDKEKQIRRQFDHFLWWQGKQINEILKKQK